MPEPFVPDLSSRPFSMTVERQMAAATELIYDAWTRRFDKWFAQPGELLMTPEEGSLFFFYNRHDWGRHAHYGRFLELIKNERVKMTWLTGAPGTYGDETVIEVELGPREGGTLLRLTHSGFSTEAACKAHEDNWPAALETLDEALSK
jgi:uncharacterized protein YndB with AHSA1/START domain